MCSINEDHMMYGFWYIKARQSCLSFWAIFCPLTILTTQNIKILKKEKILMLTLVYHKWIYVWFLIYGMQQTEFFLIRNHFLPFYPLTTQKIKLGKNEKKPGAIISQMMYGSWDMKHDRQTFLLFWVIFCPFTPLENPNNQNFEKMKKAPGDIIILHKCTTNHDHTLLFLRYDEWRMQLLFLILGCFLPFYPPDSLKNQI